MNNAQFEAAVLAAADRVIRGALVESGTLEAKAALPEPNERAARQLAALANAARDDFIIWVIGIDERTRLIQTAPAVELANWWPPLAKRFDGVAPSVESNIAVPFGSEVLQAILFRVDRRPYLVNLDNGYRELPWREANGTRPARREELLRLLLPRRGVPEVEITDAEVTEVTGGGGIQWTFDFRLYLVPQTSEPLTLSAHRSWCELRRADDGQPIARAEAHLYLVDDRNPVNVLRSGADVLLTGAGALMVRGQADPLQATEMAKAMAAVVHLWPASSERAATEQVQVMRHGTDPRWVLQRSRPWERA